jgi:sulfide:quinone oxidoreductase
MKKLLILGAGSAGTMVANRMNRMLKKNEWQITIVDPDPVHYYQPGFLFMPFGIYDKKDVFRAAQEVPARRREPTSRKRSRSSSQTTTRCAWPLAPMLLAYDYLVIATGAGHPS